MGKEFEIRPREGGGEILRITQGERIVILWLNLGSSEIPTFLGGALYLSYKDQVESLKTGIGNIESQTFGVVKLSGTIKATEDLSFYFGCGRAFARKFLSTEDQEVGKPKVTNWHPFTLGLELASGLSPQQEEELCQRAEAFLARNRPALDCVIFATCENWQKLH